MRRRMLHVIIVICVVALGGTGEAHTAHAAKPGDKELAKGEELLKNKQYSEARASLEAGLSKDPSNVQGHFNLAEACRALEDWTCAEEHYDSALQLDEEVGGSSLPKTKAKVWRLREEMKVWGLLNEAKRLLASGRMKQAEEALSNARDLGITHEQQTLFQQLQAKVPRSRSASSKHASGSAGGPQADSLDAEMVFVPAGKFTRGSNLADDEKPVRQIYLNAFYIDKYEVTVGQYARYLEATDMEEPPDWNIMNQPQHQRRPVVNVSWEDAVNYCKWAGKRLPTEAEWEKAARGTDGRIYPWGNEAPTRLHANYGRKEWDDHFALTPVGSFEAGKSPYGAYDMAGNAWEWVFDWYDHDFYKTSPDKNPIGPAKGTEKVVRGGSWLYVADFMRSAHRFNAHPSNRHFGYGFRCAKTP
ncbi:MAG: SUMF1/EgtB/PvdO family nonheme iron enzyme [Nitrospira sp.]|nr:SUMF1/EgtB/PvdO family nonheme iron enzyme [Nitrospira sp.]MCP9464483.1 SUMF1/EgtB/PvdO family nonheme iron enzyme [Nitrospira sp.]